MCRCKMGNPKKSSRFICLKHCGENFTGSGIQRGKIRERFHIKDLYCPQCKEIVKNLEVRYCDDFEEIMNKAVELHKEIYA